jgi:hypothetical protein
VSNLKPGDSGSRCIIVTSSGTVPSTVKLYGSGLATTNGLSSAMNLTVTQGSGGNANCSDFSPAATNSSVYNSTLSGFTAIDYAGGYSTAWTPTGTATEDKTFRFAWSLPAATGNSVQNGTASVTFTWEAQS